MRKKKSVFLEYAVYFFIIVFGLFLVPNYVLEKIYVDGTMVFSKTFATNINDTDTRMPFAL